MTKRFSSNASQLRMDRINKLCKDDFVTSNQIAASENMCQNNVNALMAAMVKLGYMQESKQNGSRKQYKSTGTFVLYLIDEKPKKKAESIDPVRSASHIKPFRDNWLWSLHLPITTL